jgi:hypothetical protein
MGETEGLSIRPACADYWTQHINISKNGLEWAEKNKNITRAGDMPHSA